MALKEEIEKLRVWEERVEEEHALVMQRAQAQSQKAGEMAEENRRLKLELDRVKEQGEEEGGERDRQREQWEEEKKTLEKEAERREAKFKALEGERQRLEDKIN